MSWLVVPKFTPAAALLADGHYSRRTIADGHYSRRTIFRNTGPGLSSELILEAERELLHRYDCGPDGLLPYVWDRKVASVNPGYCFKVAGWKAIGRSADGRKTLLQKPAYSVSPG